MDPGNHCSTHVHALFFFSMVGTSDFNHACTSKELENYRSMLTNFYLHQ